MKSKIMCGPSLLCFLLVLILPATCFKLTALDVKPEMLTEKSIMANKSDSTIPLTERPTTEVVSSASAKAEINLSTNVDVTAAYAEKTTMPKCDHSKQTGIVMMISFNNFGFIKSNYLMQAALDIMNKMQSERNLVRLIIDDLVPVKNAGGSFDKKDWVLTSMIRKLQFDSFSPVNSWEINVFGFLFVDETVDFSDPVLMNELRRVNFEDIHFYVVIIGGGIDMDVINRYLVSSEQIINIPSYDALNSLPSKLVEKLCVRKSKLKFDIT